ncbi:MAG: hypothetical protein KKB50_00825 [Planctomycetes bacterium]|nr:hypothetical protein [Planctomycetota bacterium]
MGSSEQTSATGWHTLSVWVLARCRATQVRNALDQQLRHAPGRTLVIVVLLLLIWTALFFLLATVLYHVRKWGVIGVVADQHIFVHFFLVLAVMLTFSNAVLTFGSLYGRQEAGYLLAMPLDARQVVCVKWIEGICLSSWSFMLLGVPLMLAVARHTSVQWYYYPLFIGHFMGFVAIPATVGLLAAWLVAMWAPRRPVATATWIGSLLVVVFIYWLSTISRNAIDSGEWLRLVLRQVAVAKQPYLPSTWAARGIAAAMEQRVGASFFYLLVVAGNAAFLAWITINVLGSTWAEAYSRAQLGRLRPAVRRAWVSAGISWLLFFYMPRRMRMLVLKDLRGFLRDATQWTQMAIMFGLLVLYVLNLTRLPVDLNNASSKGLVAFLNLITVSLILATFTSRFVYPLLSLESQQLWLLGLLPIRRVTMLLVKFVFALTITGLSVVVVMGLAVWALRLPPTWARLHLMIGLAVSVGLCGLSVGLGARFPVFGQRNPARIASGFGGTCNLITSMLFVLVMMGAVAWLSLREIRPTFELPETLSPQSWAIGLAAVALAVGVAGVSLWAGGRHLDKLEY